MRFLPALLLTLLVASCAREQRPAPGTAWKDMNHEERHYYMKQTVFPKMKEHFIAFDAKEYGQMNCATCHGAGAKDHSFKMPNPELPGLPATEEGFKRMQEKHPEAVKFMMGTVVPEMARLLDEAPFSPATHQGFGCFRCHTKKTDAKP